jgi:indolepyruvate ferredoxin oxidoreductase
LRLELHLAPNVLFLQRKNDIGGSRKWTFGPWMFYVLKWIARFKGLRGTRLDVFGYDRDRVAERKLLADYERLLDDILARLSLENHATAVILARLPEKVRGFGHVKARSIAAAEVERERMLSEFRSVAAASVKLAAE